MQRKNLYQIISYQNAQQNSEYVQFFQQQFEERAALIIQHIWRRHYYRKHQMPAVKIKPSFPHSMGFLKEPVGEQMGLYAQKIAAGEWTSLPFHDEDFVRHLSKALRFKHINLTQLAMGLLLHETKTQFVDSTLQQFRFDEEKGPYDVKNITYATAKDIDVIKKNLSSLPTTEQVYFTINFSRREESILIYDSLVYRKIHCSPNIYTRSKFVDMIGLYLRKHGLSETLCQELKAGLLHPNYDEFVKKAELEVIQHIHLFEPKEYNLFRYQYGANQDKLHEYRSSFTFLANMIGVGEQIPLIEVSPDYVANDKNSPVFCFILPHLSALSVMQKALHGKDTTQPFYLAGKFSTRLLRKLDEKPEEFKQEYSGRGVEFYHPDVVNSPSLHGGKLTPFITTFHDLFHSWRNGANVHKPMYRYLRHLFETVVGYDMSKIIWQLTDMDTNHGWLYREGQKNNSNDAMLRAANYAFYDMLATVDEKFWLGNVDNDHVLIVLIDMIKHPKNWSAFSSQLSIFLENSELPEFPWRSWRKTNSDTATAYRFIKEIIKENSYTEKDFYVFYILCYRLRVFDENGLELCKKLGEIGLDKVVSWTRNGGLCLVAKPDVKIAGLKNDELYEELTSFLRLWIPRQELRGMT